VTESTSAAVGTVPPGLADRVRARIRDVADFPEPGIVFKDVTPLLGDPEAFAAAVDGLAAPYRAERVDKVAGIEARGFIFGTPVAQSLGVGFVPVRKKGKLPGDVVTASYDLEYGTATIEVTSDAFTAGDRVLIVDDVLATGGTAAATVDLVRRSGAEVVGIAVLIELGFLSGRDALTAVSAPTVHALVVA
jgi:adenine phosphoribosyltransferase